MDSAYTVQLTFHIPEQNITFCSLSPGNKGCQEIRKREIEKKRKNSFVLTTHSHHDPGSYKSNNVLGLGPFLIN